MEPRITEYEKELAPLTEINQKWPSMNSSWIIWKRADRIGGEQETRGRKAQAAKVLEKKLCKKSG